MYSALEKLNKKVLHNRLAPSPGEAAAVQTVRIDGQFVARFAERTIERCEPQLVRIHPVLAVAMGSAVRFGTIDDLPVNVAPIRHTFLGSGKRRGYGEILIEPPHDVFFRACRKVTLPLYQLIVLTNARDLQEAMLIIRHMLKAILKLRVSMLALSDRSQDAASVEEAMGVLHLMRDRYCREISDEELMEMYREVAANEI